MLSAPHRMRRSTDFAAPCGRAAVVVGARWLVHLSGGDPVWPSKGGLVVLPFGRAVGGAQPGEPEAAARRPRAGGGAAGRRAAGAAGHARGGPCVVGGARWGSGLRPAPAAGGNLGPARVASATGGPAPGGRRDEPDRGRCRAPGSGRRRARMACSRPDSGLAGGSAASGGPLAGRLFSPWTQSGLPVLPSCSSYAVTAVGGTACCAACGSRRAGWRAATPGTRRCGTTSLTRAGADVRIPEPLEIAVRLDHGDVPYRAGAVGMPETSAGPGHCRSSARDRDPHPADPAVREADQGLPGDAADPARDAQDPAEVQGQDGPRLPQGNARRTMGLTGSRARTPSPPACPSCCSRRCSSRCSGC